MSKRTLVILGLVLALGSFAMPAVADDHEAAGAARESVERADGERGFFGRWWDRIRGRGNPATPEGQQLHDERQAEQAERMQQKHDAALERARERYERELERADSAPADQAEALRERAKRRYEESVERAESSHEHQMERMEMRGEAWDEKSAEKMEKRREKMEKHEEKMERRGEMPAEMMPSGAKRLERSKGKSSGKDRDEDSDRKKGKGR